MTCWKRSTTCGLGGGGPWPQITRSLTFLQAELQASDAGLSHGPLCLYKNDQLLSSMLSKHHGKALAFQGTFVTLVSIFLLAICAESQPISLTAEFGECYDVKKNSSDIVEHGSL